MPRIRVFLLAIIAISVLCTLATWLWRAYTQGSPLCDGCNVVLVSLDAFPARTVFDPTSKTFAFPLLAQRTMSEGITFTEAHTSTKEGWLANATLLSGMYPWEMGMWGPEVGIPKDVELLPETLKKYGYTTAGFTRGTFVDSAWGFDRGFDTFVHIETGSAEDTFTQAKEWLKNRPSDSPFFLYLQPTNLYDWFSSVDSELSYENLAQAYAGDARALESIQSGYTKHMNRIDSTLSAFQDALTTHNERPTVVVIVGSYGDEFLEKPERGIGDGPLPRKQWLHVPLSMFIPSVSAREIPFSVETRTLADTLRAIVGARSTFESLDSLVPYIKEKKKEDQVVRAFTVATNKPTFTANPTDYQTFIGRAKSTQVILPDRTLTELTPKELTAQSLILGPWHMLLLGDGTYLLFNSDRDPFEEENLMEKQHQLNKDDRSTVGMLLSTFLHF